MNLSISVESEKYAKTITKFTVENLSLRKNHSHPPDELFLIPILTYALNN